MAVSHFLPMPSLSYRHRLLRLVVGCCIMCLLFAQDLRYAPPDYASPAPIYLRNSTTDIAGHAFFPPLVEHPTFILYCQDEGWTFNATDAVYVYLFHVNEIFPNATCGKSNCPLLNGSGTGRYVMEDLIPRCDLSTNLLSGSSGATFCGFSVAGMLYLPSYGKVTLPAIYRTFAAYLLFVPVPYYIENVIGMSSQNNVTNNGTNSSTTNITQLIPLEYGRTCNRATAGMANAVSQGLVTLVAGIFSPVGAAILLMLGTFLLTLVVFFGPRGSTGDADGVMDCFCCNKNDGCQWFVWAFFRCCERDIVLVAWRRFVGALLFFVLLVFERWQVVLLWKTAISSIFADVAPIQIMSVLNIAMLVGYVETLLFGLLLFVRFFLSFDRPFVLLIRWEMMKESRAYKYYHVLVILVFLLLFVTCYIAAAVKRTVNLDQVMVSYLEYFLRFTDCSESFLTFPSKQVFSGVVFPVLKTVLLTFCIAGLFKVLGVLTYDGPACERHLVSIARAETDNKPLPRPLIYPWDLFSYTPGQIVTCIMEAVTFINSDSDIKVVSKRSSMAHYNFRFVQSLSTSEIFQLKMFFFDYSHETASSLCYSGDWICCALGNLCKKKRKMEEEDPSVVDEGANHQVTHPEALRVAALLKLESSVVEMLESRKTNSAEVDGEKQGNEEEKEGKQEEEEDLPDMKEVNTSSSSRNNCCSEFWTNPVTNPFFGVLWVLYLTIRRAIPILLIFLALVPAVSYWSIGIFAAVIVESVVYFVVFVITSRRHLNHTLKILIQWELFRQNRLVRWFSSTWILIWLVYSMVTFAVAKFYLFGDYFTQRGIDLLPPQCRFVRSAPSTDTLLVYWIVKPQPGDLYREFCRDFMVSSNIQAHLADLWFWVGLVGTLQTWFSFLVYESPSCVPFSENLESLLDKKNKNDDDSDDNQQQRNDLLLLPRVRFGMVSHLRANTQSMLQDFVFAVMYIHKPSDVACLQKLSSFSHLDLSRFRGLSENNLLFLRTFFYPFLYNRPSAENPYREKLHEVDPFCCLCHYPLCRCPGGEQEEDSVNESVVPDTTIDGEEEEKTDEDSLVKPNFAEEVGDDNLV